MTETSKVIEIYYNNFYFLNNHKIATEKLFS